MPIFLAYHLDSEVKMSLLVTFLSASSGNDSSLTISSYLSKYESLRVSLVTMIFSTKA